MVHPLRAVILILGCHLASANFGPPATPHSERLRGVLLSPAQAVPNRLENLKKDAVNSVVLPLAETESAESIRAASEHVRRAAMDLYYWIEIGRNPSVADAHPAWMASLQGHSEWRRHFPSVRNPSENEVFKTYPWVPILYREAFEAHLKRVETLLKFQPAPKGIFLNDLQGAPSACGCGNDLCRWTSDYGPIRTATRLPMDAAARFVVEVQKFHPAAKVIPVWATECEELDRGSACAGVGCFSGACWKVWTAQLMPLIEKAERIAVLLPYKSLDRDLPRYGSPAGWVSHALRLFREMPPRREGRAIPADRLIAVLQGWGLTPAEHRAQIEHSDQAGSAGHILAVAPIDQSWEPRIVRYR